MNQIRGSSVAILLGAILAVAGGIFLWKVVQPDKSDGGTRTQWDDHPKWNDIRAAASRLGKIGKWCEAKDEWAKLQVEVPKTDDCAMLRDEVDSNFRLADSMCSPKNMVDEIALPRDPAKRKGQQPETIPSDQITAIYTKGRKIRSTGFVNITGTGRNRNWLFKGDARFAYQYRIVAETTVMENEGNRIIFDLRYVDVSQLRAISDETLELNLPDEPILKLIWGELEGNVLIGLPGYAQARKVAELAALDDPRFKRLLTGFNRFLRARGHAITDADQIEYAAMIEKLAGLHLQIEYISGLGVTDIKVLDGQTFERDDLEKLGYNVSLMMDYFVGKAAADTGGSVETIRVEDVAGMLTLGYDATAKGEVKLKRKSASDGQLAEVVIEDGDIHVTGTDFEDGVEKSAHIKPKRGGLVKYSLPDRLVVLARVTWDGELNYMSRNHLLFDTKKVRNARVESYYEAARVDEGRGNE